MTLKTYETFKTIRKFKTPKEFETFETFRIFYVFHTFKIMNKTVEIFHDIHIILNKTIPTLSTATQLYMKLSGKGLAPAWVCCATTRPRCS